MSVTIQHGSSGSSSGTGDVVGPASATDGGFVKFDGTTGKLVKNSAAAITAAEVSDFSTAADARISAAIGSTVQAYDADLTTWAGLTPSANAQSLVTAADYAAMRGLLDLEAETDFYSISAANATFAAASHTHTASQVTDFSTAADARISAAIGVTVQAYDADLTAWAAVNPSSYSTTAQIAAAYQPLDSDLTSWAGVTRAAGFDTFAATPSSANLRALLSDETGTGIAYFVGGALGTPSSATLTNATGLPASGLVASTSQAVGFGSIELGHASDTTISRTGAGDIAVEGNAVYRAGGNDVPVADGGTGRSSHTAYAVLCGGTSTTSAQQSVSSVGTSGQVLTSNGAGALPTFQDAASGGSTTYGAVGTYVFAYFVADNGITAGSTIAGSSLEPAGIYNSSGTIADDAVAAAEFTKGGSALSGTWRAMGQSNATSFGDDAYITLFVRTV